MALVSVWLQTDIPGRSKAERGSEHSLQCSGADKCVPSRKQDHFCSAQPGSAVAPVPGGEGGIAGGDPEPSTEQGLQGGHRALQKWSVVRIDLKTRLYLLSVKFLPAWYLNPWAMLFELLHITNQRTSPFYRAQ